MSTFRHIAPAGAPLRLTDLGRWAAAAATSPDPSEALRAAVSARFGQRAFLTCTGRAGMTVLLRALRRLAPAHRTEVVLPGYTCYSVAASVVKAGLTPRIADISTDTLDYAPDALAAIDASRVLAIVATNLYGLPNDLPALSRTARERGVFLIDDAAQAMGATVGGRLSGTWGDAGLFSMDKGKNVSAIDGGIIITGSDEVASALAAETAGLPSPGLGDAAGLAVKALVYWAMLRPWLYWIPNRIPQLELGKTVFTTDFDIARQSRPQASLGVTMLGRLDEFTRARRANAGALIDGLRQVRGVRAIQPVAGAGPAYVRLPILAASEAARDGLIAALRVAGIGATASYPRSIAEIPGLEHAATGAGTPGAEAVARRIITLPTHPLVRPSDIARMLDVLSAVNAEVATVARLA